MDQDSTKDGAGGGNRRNWRERLGVGQDLPKISDEFKSVEADPRSGARGPGGQRSEPRIATHHPVNELKPANGDAQTAAQAYPQLDAKPGTPVARPAPMAPRFARPTPSRPDNGNSPGAEPNGVESVEPNRTGSPGLRSWATPSQPAQKPEARRPVASQSLSSAPGPERAGYSTRPTSLPGPQRPAPSRGPAAYAQAAARPSAAPIAPGNDSFGQRLRAQREAAERLAQQRLEAARDRSGRVRPDAPTTLAPRKPETATQSKAFPQREAHAAPKPAGGEQPRFTFAQEEIVAARQETGFNPEAQPPAGAHQTPSPSPAPPPNAHVRSEARLGVQQAPPNAPYLQPSAGGQNWAETRAETRVEYRPEYQHEDDGMFADEQPSLQALAPRASAAEHSAAYREFEDEFEDEPRRGRGPLLLLMSLAAVAVVFGGLIYWYQQLEGTPAQEARDLPVISAPEESAKAEPATQPQQAAVQPVAVARKQIYDRIIGEETLEPERIVPTEEEPQLRQSEQPSSASGEAEDQSGTDNQIESLIESQSETMGQDPVQSQGETQGAAPQSQSTEPLPLPLPPPPGTGEQGDLLVPGEADTQIASASPEREQLSLPEPVASSASTSDPAEAESLEEASVQPASSDPTPPSQIAVAPKSEAITAPAEAPVPRSSIYPEPTEPLAYPDPSLTSPSQDETRTPGDIAKLSEPAVEAETEANPEAVEPEAVEPEAAEPEAEQTSDVPLPRAKPQHPAREKTAAKPAPQAQPQTDPQPSGSGPVQILSAVIASGQAPAQTRAAQRPQAQPSSRRTLAIDRDLSSTASQGPASVGAIEQPAEPAAFQQVASGAPETASNDTSSASGYVVQLASFRSESEAKDDYQRLAKRHPQLVSGLKSRIQEASLGQSGSFYRLGVGPIAERGEATKLCNALIAAGEKDCLVRRN